MTHSRYPDLEPEVPRALACIPLIGTAGQKVLQAKARGTWAAPIRCMRSGSASWIMLEPTGYIDCLFNSLPRYD